MTYFPKPKIRRDPRKYHVVLEFEDNGETFLVVKFFGIHKQWWHYEIWDKYDIEFHKGRDRVVKHRKPKNTGK